MFAFRANIWSCTWGNEAWYRYPWRNIHFITWIGLALSIQSLARINYIVLCYTCMSMKNYLKISHGWIFCFLPRETWSMTRFLIAHSRSQIESRIETCNGRSTYFWIELYTSLTWSTCYQIHFHRNLYKWQTYNLYQWLNKCKNAQKPYKGEKNGLNLKLKHRRQRHPTRIQFKTT